METVNTPSELLGLMASTSNQIAVFSDGVIESVQTGDVSALAVAIQLKAMEIASERIKKETKSHLMNEVDKYPEKDFEFMGNKISKAEHGTKYLYDACGDPEWNMLMEQKGIIDTKLKEREAFLKALKAPTNFINDLTGEVVLLTPPTKTSVSGINIKIL